MQDNTMVTLYYGTTRLGVLTKTDSGYSYSSNSRNEDKLRVNLILSEYDYSLWNSFERKSDELFPEFEVFLKECSARSDILKKSLY